MTVTISTIIITITIIAKIIMIITVKIIKEYYYMK